jgi:peroxiredoxin
MLFGENAAMTIKVGDKLPEATFKVMKDGKPADMTVSELTKGKKVALFAVPGAFTPTCSVRHLPGYKEKAADFRSKGVDTVACVSVNDVFVMNAWGKDQQVGDDVVMLADGNGDFAKAVGLEMDGKGFGMGSRSKRYAMIVEDGVVKQLNIEAPGEFKVSAADYMLGQL